jgi:PAS domain S-box-containing protein
MYLVTRLLEAGRQAGGVLRLFGLLLAVFVLTGGVIATNVEIPILIPISLTMLAICLPFITLVSYLVREKHPVKLGRIKFSMLMSIQPIISLFLLVLIFFYSSRARQSQTGTLETVFIASLLSALIFLILFFFLLSYLDQISILSHASPSIFMAVFVPAVLNLTAFIGNYSYCHYPVSLAGMLLTTLVFAYTFYDYRMLFVSPFDRRLIIDAMKLGWVLVDKNEIILDANIAAEKILGKTFDSLIGQEGKTILGNWSTLFPISQFSERELQASSNRDGHWFYYHIRSLPLLQDGEFLGRLMIWNDVTERKEGDDIRKRTMDSTLNLLHSISLAASHSTDIRAFLETAIFQIVTNFNCKIGFIFMRDFEFFGEEKAQLDLVGTYSIMDTPDTEQIAQSLYTYLASTPHQQELLHLKSSDLPAQFENLRSRSDLDEFVLCPIVIEKQVQGAIILFRSDKSPFLPDEIIRLDMLAHELSTLVYVEQQRMGFASMMERKKIIRVLHDTVTQQLYGLLYFTDVARAQLDSGTINSLSTTLKRVSETGRQVLKEMRMFLHSLQPVNVSKIGLVAAINQRLDSVEGRASVKPKFVVANAVKLTPKQEICLYEITLEALNNILRHAYAKNVTITLKQLPKNIRMEIVDDGRGFDVDVAKNSGGLGLKNMFESAKQIHAKILMQSKVNTGTTIKIIFPKMDTPFMEK